jgi:hypothetical protein
LSSFVAVLSNLLLSCVRNRCQPLQSLLFSSVLFNIGQSYVLSVSVCSGVAFQPADCIVRGNRLLRCVCMCSSLSLLGIGFVNTFPRQRARIHNKIIQAQVQVQVILRLTVTGHDHFDIYFLSSSGKAPSLTRGREYNLQCNHSLVRVTQDP